MSKGKPANGNGQNLRLEWRSAEELQSNSLNWRRHPPSQVKALRGVLADVGWAGALLYNEATGRLIDGHLRKEVAKGQQVPVLVGSWTEAQEREILATLDPVGAMAQPDQDALIALLAQVETGSEGVKALLEALANSERLPLGEPDIESLTLAEKFLVPPFSVLDARQGYWQERKRQWLALGIRSELGRGESRGACNGTGSAASVTEGLNRASIARASPGGSLRDATSLGPDGKTIRGDGKGRGLGRVYGQDLMRGEHIVGENARNLTWVKGRASSEDLDSTSRKNLAAGATVASNRAMELAEGFSESHQTGTSIFDPVLCELAYRWFCPEGGNVLDPFAGGSVRGIVAAVLGRQYTGIDLNPAQIAANETQWPLSEKMQKAVKGSINWITGDSRQIATLAPGEYDFLFTCPPYFDLERYSEDPEDLSNAGDYEKFLVDYRAILAASWALLKENRFACICVGDVRDKAGYYRNFVADTIAAFRDCGGHLYNEAVLVVAVGSLPLRVGRAFGKWRKLGKEHQNVLVFLKGDVKAIPEVLGEVQIPEDLDWAAPVSADFHEAISGPLGN